MKITEQRRKEIEEAWIKDSELYLGGMALCNFSKNYHKELENIWDKTWSTQGLRTIHCYYNEILEVFDLTYLCRALSLNMLLDDNEE